MAGIFSPATYFQKMSVAPGIKGDPIVALVAQLNRFRALDHQPALPLNTELTPTIAREALTRARQRFESALKATGDTRINSEITRIDRAMSGDPHMPDVVTAVKNDIVSIVQTLALYGDSLGLEPATIGIVSEEGSSTPVIIGIAVGAVALLGLLVFQLRKS